MNQRIEMLLSRLPEGIDGVLITSSENRFYFTGMRSSDGTLLITKDQCYFIIDFRYIELAKRTIKGCEVILQDKLKEQLQALAQKHNLKRVGLESAYLNLKDYLSLKPSFPDAELVLDNAVNDIIQALRMIKSPEEVAEIAEAQRITELAFDHILTFIQVGKTEKEIALELEFFARTHGADSTSFDFIVVSGVNSSLPHGVPSHKKVENGDFITMDFGVKVNGYCSDMTRTVAVGQVSEEQDRLYQTVLRANLEAEKAVRSGVVCSEIDKVARDIIYGAGYEGCFGHGLGHSVGIEIHEEPRFSTTCNMLTQPNMIMTVEPGIYVEGKFGCRIEDMILVTENGCDCLTKCKKELIIL